MLRAAFSSRSSTRPDSGHTWVRDSEAFLAPFATAGTILRGELGRDGNHGHVGNRAVGAKPREKLPPRGIVDALGQMVVLDEVGNPQVFVGNQVARPDQRTCRLDGEVFTLSTDLEIAFGEALNGFFAILGALSVSWKPADASVSACARAYARSRGLGTATPSESV